MIKNDIISYDVTVVTIDSIVSYRNYTAYTYAWLQSFCLRWKEIFCAKDKFIEKLIILSNQYQISKNLTYISYELFVIT